MNTLGAAVLATLTVCLSAGGAWAAEDTVEDLHRQCGADYADAAAVAKCLTAEENDYGKRLATTYEKVTELQAPDAKKALSEAQKSWLKYQEQDCDFHERALSFDSKDEGAAAEALCRLRTTMQRLAELEALLPQLEH
jgi:uncharacterized protein YecT (DUF1311 family)